MDEKENVLQLLDFSASEAFPRISDGYVQCAALVAAHLWQVADRDPQDFSAALRVLAALDRGATGWSTAIGYANDAMDLIDPQWENTVLVEIRQHLDGRFDVVLAATEGWDDALTPALCLRVLVVILLLSSKEFPDDEQSEVVGRLADTLRRLERFDRYPGRRSAVLVEHLGLCLGAPTTPVQTPASR